MTLQSTFPQNQVLLSPEDCKMNWDSARYDKTPVRRLQDEISKMNISPPRNVLQPWNRHVDNVVPKTNQFTTPSSSEYFHCETCDLPFSTSRSMFDHIHGIKHQRRTGMLMELDRSSLDQVKSLYALRIQELEEEKVDDNNNNNNNNNKDDDDDDNNKETINFHNYHRLIKQDEFNKYRGLKRQFDDDDEDEFFDDPNNMSPCGQVYARSMCAKKLRFV